MDLNKLYFRHQLLTMQAKAANSIEARATIDSDAAQVAGRIGRMQHLMGAAAAASWTAAAAVRAINDRAVVPLGLPLAASSAPPGEGQVDESGQ